MAARAVRRREPEFCLELRDYSACEDSAVHLFRTWASPDARGQAARLAHQFIELNRPVFAAMDTAVECGFDGTDVLLRVVAGGSVGAAPLRSPVTAKWEHGLVIQPRFDWPGLGPLLAETGWRVVPEPMRLPLLKRSARRVPRWVLAVIVLARLKALLESLERRFEMSEETRMAPRGRVHWGQYAGREVPRAGFLRVPCVFPDLRQDRELRAAIRYCLELQIGSLETQREHGAFIHQLILLAEHLRRGVLDTPARAPSPTTLEGWLRRPLRREPLVEGIQAIEWTVEERGLAGLSDLEGIPWRMPMEQLFEAWVETILAQLARKTGAVLKTGRRRETVVPLEWDPPYSGSQRFLLPDLWLEWESRSLIVDAKYKRHWEELEQTPWYAWEEDLRHRHREDLLQVLAYANLARASEVIVCLVYPCAQETWASLARRGRLFHRALVPVHGRRLSLWLTAAPMCPPADRLVECWTLELHRQLQVG